MSSAQATNRFFLYQHDLFFLSHSCTNFKPGFLVPGDFAPERGQYHRRWGERNDRDTKLYWGQTLMKYNSTFIESLSFLIMWAEPHRLLLYWQAGTDFNALLFVMDSQQERHEFWTDATRLNVFIKNLTARSYAGAQFVSKVSDS